MKVPDLAPITGWASERFIDAKSIIRKFTGEQIVVLGDEKVGKSTLITYMTTNRLPAEKKRTLDAVKVDKAIHLEMEGSLKGKKTRFIISQDLPGNDNTFYPLWKPAAFEANRVWYLFRADHVLAGHKKTIELINDHIRLLKDWRDKDLTPPAFSLIGTGADRIPGWSHHDDSAVRAAIDDSPIQPQAVKLGNAPIIIGSLKTVTNAQRLVAAISKEI